MTTIETPTFDMDGTYFQEEPTAEDVANYDKYQNAKSRIDTMEFNDAEIGFIWADWENWNEHIDWLLTASRKEIKSWIDANY
jgi:hypothetical protein